jgi:O-methyltransferase
MNTPQLLTKYPIISDQIGKPALSVVLRELEKVLIQNVEGDVVELGCYIGTTSLFIRRLLNQYSSDKRFYAYDSFEGLPEKVGQDDSGVGQQFKGGELSVSKKQFLNEFRKANLHTPITIDDYDHDALPGVARAVRDFFQDKQVSLHHEHNIAIIRRA